MDIGIELRRDKNSDRREISGQGRVIEIENLIYERLQDGGFHALGSVNSVRLQAVKDRILETLSNTWKRTKEIQFALDLPKPSLDQVTKALYELSGEDRAERDPPISSGKQQGKTHRWRRVVNESAPSLESGTSKSRKIKTA